MKKSFWGFLTGYGVGKKLDAPIIGSIVGFTFGKSIDNNESKITELTEEIKELKNEISKDDSWNDIEDMIAELDEELYS